MVSIALLFHGATFHCTTAHAQTRDGFFDNGFVTAQQEQPEASRSSRAPLIEGSSSSRAGVAPQIEGFTEMEPPPRLRTPTPPSLPVEPQVGETQADRSSQDSASSQAATGSASSESSPFDGIPGEVVERLGVIVNGMDREHAFQVLNTFRDLSIQRDWEAGLIVALAPAHGFGEERLDMFIRRLEFLGAEVDLTSTPPSEYKVSKSPTWILGTKRGEILLEGAPTPAKYLNRKGEFVDPRALLPELTVKQ